MIIQKRAVKATLLSLASLELACPVPNARRYTLLVYLSGRVADSPAQSPALQQANSKAGAAGKRAKQEAQGKICQGQEQQQQQPEAMSNEAVQDLVSASLALGVFMQSLAISQCSSLWTGEGEVKQEKYGHPLKF